MKINKLLIVFGTFAVTLLTALAVTSGNAFAAVRTWDGGGSDDNFSTATNWDTDTAPVNGDSLVFPTNVLFSGCTDSSSPVTLNNDLDSSTTTLAGITATGGKPTGCYSNFDISGNALKLSGNLKGSPDGKFETITMPAVEITGDLTLSDINVTGSVNIGTHNLVYERSISTGYLIGSGNVTIKDKDMHGGGVGSGGGDCAISIYDDDLFSGDNSSFSGALVLEGNTWLVVGPEANIFARKASGVTLNGGASLAFFLANNTDLEYSKPITVNDGYISVIQVRTDYNCNLPTIKQLTLSGNIAITADTAVYLDYANIKFTGEVTGKEHLKLIDGGVGSLLFADGSTIEAQMKVVTIDSPDQCGIAYTATGSNSKLVINADCSDNNDFNSAENPFETSGIIGGTGKVGHIKIRSGGTVAPGLSPGTLTTGNITWEEGGNYEFEIGKDGADKIIANGTVALGNGNLKVLRFEDYVPKAGDVYIIIENDGTDAVNGTFKDLPEGATFATEDGGVYRVNYGGGDGNDVTIEVVTAPKVPNTGFNLLKNNPILTLVITTGSAVIIAVIAKKNTLKRV